MQIDVRAAERLRGKNPVNLGPILSSLTETLRESPLDLSRLRVVCDWVQYRQNFRNIVDVRQIMPSALKASEDGNYEIAIDLRRAASIEDLTPVLATAIARASQDAEPPGYYLEEWKPASASVIWDFNGLYWNSLGLWEEGTGREYEQALPGGESDARNTEAARSLIERLFAVWDDLAARRALPEDLHVLELGVGNGNQAKVWLDEFRRLDREQHKDYYRRLHYLMADYSPHVLERARDNVKEHASRCSSLVLDARVPTQTLGFLRSKAFLIYISNVYDNLPSDEIVRIGGHLYNVEVRAYISTEAAIQLAGQTGVEVENLPDLVLRLLQLGPDLLARASPEVFKTGPLEAVGFWRDVWENLRLEERYVPIEGLDQYRIANGITGEVLRPIVEANGDVRMQISNGAAASFLDSVPLLHPFGILECHDIFVTDLDQYKKSFRGPGKYDGSVVNWVNGALLAAVGRRNGYDVTYESFAYRSGSNITTLVARVQE